MKWAEGGTVGDLAKSGLFEMQNLAVGSLAPEIEGLDQDGLRLKLTDYRGKVVVLDFWREY
ncbi:MAG: redoxin domain-containing protein [Gemmataceae bacterium]|nr:redoxin domain-containing protein [Gemmataceae bacterium]